MSKKTIIIIGIILAIAFYFLWKKKKEMSSVASELEAEVSETSGNKNNLEAVIAVAFGNDQYASTFAAKAREVYNYCKSSLIREQDLQAKADRNGITFAQQAVLDGAYVECYKQVGDKWVPRDAAHLSYFNKVKERVFGM